MNTKEIMRTARGEISQLELSKRLNNKPAQGQISQWENGKKPSLENFIRVCKGAEVKPSDVLKKLGL